MNIRQVVFSLLVTWAGASLAQPSRESCEVMKKVDGVLTSVQVPCSQVKRPTTPDQEAALQKQRDEQAARKRKCGKDFEALRIGMSLDRYEECTEALDYVTETVTKTGIVKTYRSTFYLIQSAGGKIISYTRL